MKTWKPFPKFFSIETRNKKIITATICFIVFYLTPIPLSKGCGPIDKSFHGYSFINPDVVLRAPGFAPYFVSFPSFYTPDPEKIHSPMRDNLREWKERYCNRAKLEDIQYIVYHTTIRELEQLKSAILSESIPLDYRISKNTFARYLERFKCTETIDYLIFAKRCEPYVLPKKDWDDRPLDTDYMQELIAYGEHEFMDTESYYIRLRYAYQIIRLAHYSKSYKQVLQLYDNLMPKIDNDPSILDYWILGHKAGALMSLGKNVEASYLFSKIFQNCPSKRSSAIQSFKITTDEEWYQCLLLCQNDEERATLHAMRGYFSDSRALEEMEEIYLLSPKNQHLELLLIREIQKLEKDLLGYEFNDKKATNRRYHKLPRKFAGEYLIEMQEFVKRMLDENQIARYELWKVTDGYLELLAGNYYQARRTFSEARALVENDTLKEQLAVCELALQISSIEKISSDIETNIANVKRRNEFYEKYEDFTDFLDDKLASLYKQSGSPGKAFIQHYTLNDIKPNPRMDILNDLIELCKDNRLNRLEREMVEEGDSTILNGLLDIKASELLSQGKLEAALETYKQMRRANWDDYGSFNPFVDRINDCVDLRRRGCRLPDTLTTFNKGELMEQLYQMEYEAKSGIGDAAQLYYQLGVAFYNMTYYSYAWNITDYYRSGASLARVREEGDNILSLIPFPYGNKENMDCAIALSYFEKARMAAGGNSEIGARATFMAAKCERNMNYINREPDDYEYFALLKENYQDTEFYEEVVEECLYFNAYDRY